MAVASSDSRPTADFSKTATGNNWGAILEGSTVRIAPNCYSENCPQLLPEQVSASAFAAIVGGFVPHGHCQGGGGLADDIGSESLGGAVVWAGRENCPPIITGSTPPRWQPLTRELCPENCPPIVTGELPPNCYRLMTRFGDPAMTLRKVAKHRWGRNPAAHAGRGLFYEGMSIERRDALTMRIWAAPHDYGRDGCGPDRACVRALYSCDIDLR